MLIVIPFQQSSLRRFVMKEFFRVLRTVWVLAFALLIVLPTIASAQGEIPLTTKSDEARKIFLQARQLFDNVRFDEAREFFSKAVEKDRILRSPIYTGLLLTPLTWISKAICRKRWLWRRRFRKASG
jgi:hypothetical protein